jgi:predicted nicotinamide N-methyase
MSKKSRWHTKTLGTETFEILNVRHPDFMARVMDEMDSGVDVYYDSRWKATEIFSQWLLDNPETVKGKRVLALGVGIGLETLPLGKLCEHLYINDLAPISLELCSEQLEQNGITNFTAMPGPMELLELPNDIDIAIACFLIYEDITRAAVTAFIENFPGEIIVANGPLPAFEHWRVDLKCEVETLISDDTILAVRLHQGH